MTIESAKILGFALYFAQVYFAKTQAIEENRNKVQQIERNNHLRTEKFLLFALEEEYQNMRAEIIWIMQYYRSQPELALNKLSTFDEPLFSEFLEIRRTVMTKNSRSDLEYTEG